MTVFRAAAALGCFVGAGCLDGEYALAALLEAALTTGLSEKEARSHIARGLRRGAETPRTIPDGARGRGQVVVPLPPPPVEPPQPVLPPPGTGQVWADALPVTEDPEASAWLISRGLDPDAVTLWDLARAIPAAPRLPRWAWTKAGGAWTQSGHRLVLPLRDATGRLAALRARCVQPGSMMAKSLTPVGVRATGLVLACPLAAQVLAGEALHWWMSPSFVIAEGEPDFLTWASRQREADEQGPAVLGIGAGAWTASIAARIPDGARVSIRTHHDGAGEKYANAIVGSLQSRCDLMRSRVEGTQ